jgi:DNA-binding transcriptional LysR family regulator
MFELYQLRYFLAVVETGNFTKAAERACVTQPTLSAGIKKLEQQVEVQIFNRSSRRVFLTEAGTRFLEHAKAILYECNAATTALQKVEVKKALKLGVLHTIPAKLISKLLGDFRRGEAGVVLELFEGTEQELANRLAEGSIDLAITLLHDDGEGGDVLLFEEGYGLFVANDHAQANRKKLQGATLADDQMIVRTRCEVLSETSRYFTDRNVRPRLVFRTQTDERALEMVSAGLGVTVMPSSYQHDGVKKIHLDGFDFRRKVGLKKSPHLRHQGEDGFIARFQSFTASQPWAPPVRRGF